MREGDSSSILDGESSSLDGGCTDRADGRGRERAEATSGCMVKEGQLLVRHTKPIRSGRFGCSRSITRNRCTYDSAIDIRL